MKKKWQSRLIVLAIALGLYVALITVLTRAENAETFSSIHSIGDAIWYSLVTLTTVGYGDMSPVTSTGRAIGFIFLILSTGVLVTSLGAFMSFFTGQGLPALMLIFLRHKNWYYFADIGHEAMTLAKKIVEDDEDAVIIFGRGESVHEERPDYPCLFLNMAPERVCAIKHGVGSRCKVFLMKENDITQNSRAVNMNAAPMEVYARTDGGSDALSSHIHFFHSYDCCAREYWLERPLGFREKHISIIGFGKYGKAILERAILTNVLSPESRTVYHVFGDVGNFIDIHPSLSMTFAINHESEDMESILFYKEEWSRNHDILAKSDRIIICDDDERKGWEIYWQIEQYYILRGQIDLRSSRNFPGISCFGTDEMIYTPEQILRTKQNKIAVAMNEVYRNSNPNSAKPWNKLDEYLKQSKIAAADHLKMKVMIIMETEHLPHLMMEDVARAYLRFRSRQNDAAFIDRLRRIEHLRWLRFYSYYNWQYGEVRDSKKRQDPRILPYDYLTEEQKEYCDNAWELMGEITFRDDDY